MTVSKQGRYRAASASRLRQLERLDEWRNTNCDWGTDNNFKDYGYIIGCKTHLVLVWISSKSCIIFSEPRWCYWHLDKRTPCQMCHGRCGNFLLQTTEELSAATKGFPLPFSPPAGPLSCSSAAALLSLSTLGAWMFDIHWISVFFFSCFAGFNLPCSISAQDGWIRTWCHRGHGTCRNKY